MKVCLISFEYPPNIRGGSGTYAENLVRGLEERGIDVYIITSGEMEIYDKRNCRIFAPSPSHWQRFHFTERALSLSKSRKFDLLHFNGLYPITRSLGLPTVCTLHSSKFTLFKKNLQMPRKLKTVKSIVDLLKQPILSLFDTIMVREADKIICPSPSLAKELSYYLIDNRKIHVIPNGIDLKGFDRIKAFDNGFLEKYPIEKENFILFMGRLVPLKGVEYLIEAFKSVRKECTNLKLVIAGSGQYEPYLKNIARNIEDVLFVGFVGSPSTKKFLYETSLALAVPSLQDTFPLVLLEAMACSKPIIGTNVGGIPSIIKHGKNGFLARRGNSKDLAKFITRLCQNPDLRRKMGKLGRKIVEKEFTVNKMVSETLKVYKLLS